MLETLHGAHAAVVGGAGFIPAIALGKAAPGQ